MTGSSDSPRQARDILLDFDYEYVVSHKPSIVIIVGPTGVGKTGVAISLAAPLGGEIISADAMQVYRYMDIGTAKPTPLERAQVKHHLVDAVDPDEPFTAARFRNMACEKIRELHEQGIPVFVVGGTGLYVKALTQGLFDEETGAESDPSIREKLTAEAQSHGADVLYERLRSLDPQAAERIHPNDAYRIVRALEVFETTGKPISQHHGAHGFSESPYRQLKIGLTMDRDVLYSRIDRRVEQMIQAGLVEEVRGLMARGYRPELKAMQSIGYRHVVAYLQDDLPWDEMVDLFKRDTRRYAKRQWTWFGADKEIGWFEPSQIELIRRKIEAFLTT